MLKMYSTDMQTNITEETKEFKKGNWINMVSPTEDEIKMVCSKLEIQEDFIRYSLDEEEKARIDIEEDDNTILYIIAIPTLIASVWGMNVELPFQRSPLGFAIITVISVILCVIATIWLKRKHMLN